MRTTFEVEAVLYGVLVATDFDHDLIAVVLNERFTELGAHHPIPYSDEPDTPI
jgi:hypothetical protein